MCTSRPELVLEGHTKVLNLLDLRRAAVSAAKTISIYLDLSRKHKNTRNAVSTYSRQDSEITIVLNTALKYVKEMPVSTNNCYNC